MSVLFVLAVAFCAYTYVGFPVLLHMLAMRREREELVVPETLPSVSVVIAAHNELGNLPAKLASLKQLDYPAELLDIIVVSDGSTDGSLEYLHNAEKSMPQLKVVALHAAAGKPSALNAGVEASAADVLVFMDARQSISINAVQDLVAALSSPGVGAASGELVLLADSPASGRKSLPPEPVSSSSDAVHVGLYWRYEKWIRANESRRFSTTGATGALYAIRREDYVPHRPDVLLDDFDTPIKQLERGQRTVFVANAFAYDRAEPSGKGEFRRKARTLAGNFQSFSRHLWLFDPRRNPVWWQFLSHKVFRLLVPYAMLIALISSALGEAPWLRIMLLLQILFYGAGIASFLGVNNRLTDFIKVFLQLNAAAVVGALRWATGATNVRWKG